MFGADILVPIEWGNMLLWIWLELFALAMVVLWTSNAAFIVSARRLTTGKPVHLRHKKSALDWLPLNSDLRALPTTSKSFFTLMRLVMSVLVAVSGIGIDPGLVFTQWESTTHLVVATNANFTGRSFIRRFSENIHDIAVAACEDLNEFSLEKYRAFLSEDGFSCNSGPEVGNRETLAEIIWDREAVLDIMLNGTKQDVNIKLGDLSMMDELHSNSTQVVLTHSDGIPISMYIGRSRLPNAQYGTCDGERGYLVVYNRPLQLITRDKVAVAYVICEPGSTVFLRNTDQMMYLPDYGSQQLIILARQVGGSLVSIVPDETNRMYFGATQKATSVSSGYDYLVVLLGVVNSFLFVATRLLRRHYEKGLYVNVFSPLFMFSLAESHCRGDDMCNKPVEKGVILGGVERGLNWDVRPVSEGQELVARRPVAPEEAFPFERMFSRCFLLVSPSASAGTSMVGGGGVTDVDGNRTGQPSNSK